MKYEWQPSCQIAPEILEGIYLESFGYKPSGWFVEVGASNGWEHSNTWGLAKAGWHGLYVEPLPKRAEECRHVNFDNPFVYVAEGCCGAFNGRVKMGLGEFGATLRPEWRTKPGEIEVEQWTLNRLLKDWLVPPGFEVLVVDVEGAEAEVLEGFHVESWRPKVAILERPPFRNGFKAAGYRAAYVDAINTIYVRNGL